MATTGEPFGLFWDSESGDRTYSAASWEYWLKKFFTSGVFNGDLQVKASSGMTLEIEPGYANVDGKVKFWNGAFTLTLNAANSTYPRIDTIVITRDNVNRQIVCEVVTGAYSGDTPQPTAPVRNSEIYQLVLAQIYVGAGVTGITQANITDTRPNNELCGYITGTVEELDFSAFTAQFEAYFAEFKSNKETDYASWFNAVQQQQIQDKAAWDAWYAALREELHNLPADSAEYLQIQIDELKESGLSGSIFKITTINASLEGKTVTISNADNTEVRTATFDENLECMIYGFKSVGQITITSTDGIQTATSVVTIPYFGNYTFPIAFWAATVNIQGDTNLYGATITVKDSDDLTVGTVILSSTDGTGTFTATKADTYTFNYTYQGTNYSQELVVSEETTYSISLSAGFDWKDWVDTASQLDSSDYASLSEVLADEKALRELFLEHACVDYMAESTASNADLETIINDDYCAKWINNSDYALDFLGANTAIKALMDTADKYGYGEWVITDSTTTPPTWGAKGNVPVMTANNAPYGTASAYQVFDGNASTTASSTDFSYKFVNPICPKDFYCDVSGGTLQASNDGSTWATPTSGSYYLYLRLHFASSVSPHTIQFYGRELKVSVPTMTSNTAPFGEVSASSHGDSLPWKAFDKNSSTGWFSATNSYSNQTITYAFSSDVCVKKVHFISYSTNVSLQRATTIHIQASKDNTTYTDLATFNSPSANANANVIIDISNNDETYKYYQLKYDSYSYDSSSSGGGKYCTAEGIQFYGLDYSEKEFEAGTTKKWLYDHGVELEPITTNNGTTGEVIKKEDSILLKIASAATSGSVVPQFFGTLEDLTTYNLVRVNHGKEAVATSTNKTYYGIRIGSVAPLVSGAVQIANTLIKTLEAMGEYLDISSVNQQAYIIIYNNDNYNGACEITELWLE